MKNKITIALSLALMTGLTACGQSNVDTEATRKMEQAQTKNTVLAKWQGPFEGVPAFDTVKLDDLKPAFDIAISNNLAEIDAVVNNPEPATFENTIVELERAGSDLNRIYAYYGIWRSNKSSPEVREVAKDLGPKLSEFRSKVNQNKGLFERIKAVYESEEMKTLRKDQQKMVKESYQGFVRSGALLNDDDQKRYAEINLKLSEIHTQFGNNILADEENYVTYLTKEQIGGLPESVVTAAKNAAVSLGKEDQYAITNTRSSMDPFLTYSTERELREQVWNTYYSRGDNGDEFDNNKIIAEILKLRHERVQLLGYDNYGQWRLENRMAKNPENAFALMNAVWPAAIARVEEEVADMQAIADKEGADITIAPWDYRFYAEKVRKAKYDLDSDEVKQYLQLDNLREAMFYVAGELFDFKFTPVEDGSVPVFDPEVKVWEVTKLSSGKHVGVWYLDPYARKGKRSGAWATTYRSFTSFDGVTNVLASNNSNFIKGEAGKPTLISWSDAETLFHEFGHALHFLASNVEYPTQNGGVRDYTEFQSQLLERWLTTDPVIDNYLVHNKTGKPIPADLVAKIKKAATFNEGFKTTEYLASAIIDLKLHTMDPKNIDIDKFERETLAEMNMPKEMVMRHRTPQFGHVFSGEGYSAGYYGYMWAEVLTSDAAEAFEESPGGYYDKAMAKKLVDHLFAPRNSIDPAEAYKMFRGRDAKVEALMRDRGFPIPKK
ncbi:peptidase M3 [Psychrosphaera saromensis]|uniref:oligopeptidase A n=2 Tax=Psychrosphaera saromensis TaxID=716813 RepID=A0A2S7UV44_9GAMM|nr:M3 family metallopeptidase [Psychrosphaera saromensis]PQJ53827.1 peptidase M3 [Psychrosphaera saromensis]GHB62076.1 peptidase M3 [Psychrosphaera saromensis]GLQ15381.1 peptidase M3 [Psychrosphaera saromensis]